MSPRKRINKPPLQKALVWIRESTPRVLLATLTAFALFSVVVLAVTGEDDEIQPYATSTPVYEEPTVEPTPDLPKSPQARIKAIIREHGSYEYRVEIIGKPYEVYFTLKDPSQEITCDEATQEIYGIQRSLYTDKITKRNISVVSGSIPAALLISIGAKDAKEVDWSSWESFYKFVSSRGEDINDESVPLDRRTWIEGNWSELLPDCEKDYSY